MGMLDRKLANSLAVPLDRVLRAIGGTNVLAAEAEIKFMLVDAEPI